MRSVLPIVKNLVLVGGGHAHALVIRMWAMKPLAGVRVTLVSPNWQTPYSGMLPGLLAGHYQSEDIHIDLRKVCTWAGVRFIESHVTSIDNENQILELSDHPAISFNTVSIDIGSTPDLTLPGLKEYAQAVKPIDHFYPRYLACVQRCKESVKNSSSKEPFRIAVVGGGAGGIEVALAMAQALTDIRERVTLTVVVRGDQILEGYPPNIAKTALHAFKKMQVSLQTGFEVTHVTKNTLHAGCSSSLKADEIFFCTQARGANWPGESGLACDAEGFIQVNACLQSVNQPAVFAAGDIAAMMETPRPKAGVYAVRQAPILFENLKRSLLKEPLKAYVPQDGFLSLLSLGAKKAIASKKQFSVSNTLFQTLTWHLKNHIDVSFMNQFKNLPELTMSDPTEINPSLVETDERTQIRNHQIRCAGCGGKIGSSLLRQVLNEVEHQRSPEEHYAPEDAAIFTTPVNTLIQTVDQISSPIDSPYIFGKLATLHALSDIFAMNALPFNAQLLLNLPYAASNIQVQEMTLIMQGVLETLSWHNCSLIGGHTAEATELSLGFVINALPQKDKSLFTKNQLKAGDTLVLTKAIGTGVILAAQMQGLSQGDWYQTAINSMLESNQAAAMQFSEVGVTACTDVTGFGLAGHLCEMLQASECEAEINLTNIPILMGAETLSIQGIKSSLYPQNFELIQSLSIAEEVSSHSRFPLLFDPQTSGGLLAGLDTQALEKLKNQSEIEFHIIGKITHAMPENNRYLKISC